MCEKEKNCPFCGYDLFSIEGKKSPPKEPISYWSWAECFNCGARGPIACSNIEDVSDDFVIRLWNDRVESDE